MLENITASCFTIEIDREGVALMQLKPNQSTALLWMEEFVEIAHNLVNQEPITGIILQVEEQPEEDYKVLFEWAKEKKFAERIEMLLIQFSKLSQHGKPLVAILPSRCQGSILSWMLWAHYRIAVDSDGFTIHFPEIKYGLFPLFGAVYNTLKLAPASAAIALLTQGNPISLVEATSFGLLDLVVSTSTQAIHEAKDWITRGVAENQESTVSHSKNELLEQACRGFEKRANKLIPAVNAFIHLVNNATQFPLNSAWTREAELLTETVNAPETLNIVRTQYYGVKNALKSSIDLDYNITKIGVLGAGMMGSGIAFEAARAGLHVVLKDVTLAQAEQGKSYSEKLTYRLVEQQRLHVTKREELLSRIYPTDNVEDLQNSDVIIEAVFEDIALKSAVTQEAFPFLKKEGIFATNTTSLPIARLSQATPRPENFIGLHFFSPVDRMALVEIIVGKQTNKTTLLKALQVVRTLGKIPIVVHDSPAFFTSRIFFNYLLEAITLLLEGVSPQLIEDTARNSGFAVGPLAVLDEISIPLMMHVYDQLPSLDASQRRAYQYLDTMLAVGRNGRKGGKGFYDYPAEGNKTIWIDGSLKCEEKVYSQEDISRRLLHVMALDSYRCLEEGVLPKVEHGDLGSVLGIGFPAHTGGVFGYIDLVGLQAFVADCTRFQSCGPQWQVPHNLRELAKKDYTFYLAFQSTQ